jgi:hypothetical protein
MKVKFSKDNQLVISEVFDINNAFELKLNLMSIKEICVFGKTFKIYTKSGSMFVLDAIVNKETITNWIRHGIVVNVNQMGME